MEILELVSAYGTMTYTTSIGDTLKSVARKVYHSDDEMYQEVLKVVNGRFDWSNLKPSEDIEYIQKKVLDKYYVTNV